MAAKTAASASVFAKMLGSTALEIKSKPARFANNIECEWHSIERGRNAGSDHGWLGPTTSGQN
ncbi:hypothetical protein ARTHRO9V_40004 [Arthrobacter sp. 9V]|nr:hypothetical protein ARTHRO9V_40004 [Arthrobacter sp. 9V]